MYRNTYLRAFVTAVLTAIAFADTDKGCWWSFCQLKTWLHQGCHPQHLYYQKESRSCYYGGTMYRCCSFPKASTTANLSDNNESNLIDTSAEESGICSWYGYGDVPQGSPTASGEPFNRYAMTAAHKTLPFGTRIRVKHAKTKKTVDVTINDRGPFITGRILDLSYSAFGKLENRDKGLIRCSYTIIS